MDKRNLEIIQKKQSRRKILDALKMVYPASLSFESICAVIPDVEDGYLKKDVAYLMDKGAILCINARRNQSIPDGDYRLTAEGVELADRINIDPALEI